MSRIYVALAGAAVVLVSVVTVVVIWGASEPPARGDTPPAQPEPQREPEPPPEPAARVGSDTSIEGIVLGEVYRRAMEENGFAAEHDRGNGGLDALGSGLSDGSYDVVPGFSDTGGPIDAGVPGAEMLAPSPGAKSEYVVVTTEENVERYGLSDVADLAGVPEPVVGSTPTTDEDPLADLWPRLNAPAGPEHTRPAGPGEAVALLTSGGADAVVLDSLEGSVAAEDLVILTDEENLVADAPLYPAAVVRTGFLDEYPEARAVLEDVSQDLTTEDARGLIAETEANGGDPEGPVAAYYEREVSGG